MTAKNRNGDSGELHFDEEMSERYLFGEMSEAEQEQFETAYFADDAFFERFLAVKTELLDLYSRGELDPETQARMEPHFLGTAPRRQKIAESGDFIRAVTAVSARAATADKTKSAPAATSTPGLLDSMVDFFTVPRFAAAGVLILVAIGGIWILVRSGQNRGESADRAVQQQAPGSSAAANPDPEVATSAKDPNTDNDPVDEPHEPEIAPAVKPGQKRFAASRRARANPALAADRRLPNKDKETSTDRPVNERAATGFALTLSTVGRDPGKPVGPAPTSGLNIGGQRGGALKVELTGKVLDPNGDIVAGATVFAVNKPTGLLRSTTTAADGSYQFTELPAGKYEITAEAAALMKTRIPALTLTAQRSELQIRMEPGGQDAIVSVTGDPESKRERTEYITLESVASRDFTEKNTVRLRSYTRTVGVWLAFEGGPYRRLSARIAAVDGTRIWQAKDLKVVSDDKEKYARVLVPATLLRRKDYIVTLEARTAAGQTETIREYYFHVDRPRPTTPEAERDRPMKP